MGAYVKLMHTSSRAIHQGDWYISMTANPGTTPAEIAPPGMAMATVAPELVDENASALWDPDVRARQTWAQNCLRHPESHPMSPSSAPAVNPHNTVIYGRIIEGPVLSCYEGIARSPHYASMHNARVPCAPAITTGSRTLDRTLSLDRCRSCGHPEGLLTIWYDNERETVCGACFAWACQAMRTIKVQRFYV